MMNWKPVTNIRYSVANYSRRSPGSLVDRGANGSIGGDDTRIIARTTQKVDLSGIDNHEMCNIPVCTIGGYTMTTQNGPVIVIMHNYAVVPGHKKTIHSCVQMEDNGVIVDDRHPKANGTHCLTTSEGYKIPLSFRRGLPYMNSEFAVQSPFYARWLDQVPDSLFRTLEF